MRSALARLAALAVALLLPTGPLLAQGTELGRQTLGRPYWHVFLAYALTLLLIGGWAISIARRLGEVERRLDEDPAARD